MACRHKVFGNWYYVFGLKRFQPQYPVPKYLIPRNETPQSNSKYLKTSVYCYPTQIRTVTALPKFSRVLGFSGLWSVVSGLSSSQLNEYEHP